MAAPILATIAPYSLLGALKAPTHQNISLAFLLGALYNHLVSKKFKPKNRKKNFSANAFQQKRKKKGGGCFY